jgi:alkaline phosphatase D
MAEFYHAGFCRKMRAVRFRIDRRGLLKGAGGLLALWGAGCGDEDRWAGEGIADAASFPDGVIAAPGPGGVHLVAHVAGLRGPARLGVEIAADPGFDALVARTVVDVPPGPADVPLHLRLPLPGAAPSRRHFYRLASRAGVSPVGSFKTWPAAGERRPMRLAFFSCQGWQAGYFTSHAGLAAEPDLDLAVSLGDYIYELTDDTGPAARTDTIGVAGDGFAETLEEYRQKYRHYRSDRDLQATHAAHGFVGVWDSHELAEDGEAHLGDRVPRFPAAVRSEHGRQAFWDCMPMDPGPPGAPLYRSLRLGDMVELFLLDLHTHAVKGETYLGAEQRAWLFEGLAASTARWKILGSSTVMMGLELAAGVPVNTGQWDGYPAERRALVEHVRQAGVRGVVAVTGDLHTFLAAPVTTTGLADGEPGLVELSPGAISSQGLLNLTPGDGAIARIYEEAARRVNPHLAFIDVLARGYGVMEAREDELLFTFRSPETVLEPVSPMRDLAAFRVPHGEPRVERIA